MSRVFIEDGNKYFLGNVELPCNDKVDFENLDSFCGDMACRIYLKEAPNSELEDLAREKDGLDCYSPDCFFIEATMGRDSVEEEFMTSNWFLFYVLENGENLFLDDSIELLEAWEYFKEELGSDISLSDDLAYLDTDKTVFEVCVNAKGEKEIHYFGYFYPHEDGMKLVEYTGYSVSLDEALKEGIYEFEMNHADELGGNQYITDFDGLSVEEEFETIDNYFNGKKIVHLCKDAEFIDLPVGCYAISIHTAEELKAMKEKSVENLIDNAKQTCEEVNNDFETKENIELGKE